MLQKSIVTAYPVSRSTGTSSTSPRIIKLRKMSEQFTPRICSISALVTGPRYATIASVSKDGLRAPPSHPCVKVTDRFRRFGSCDQRHLRFRFKQSNSRAINVEMRHDGVNGRPCRHLIRPKQCWQRRNFDGSSRRKSNASKVCACGFIRERWQCHQSGRAVPRAGCFV